MNRQFGISAIMALMFLASSCLAQDASRTKALIPELSISVHDYADVPSELMAEAERAAHSTFHQAGVETVWLNCSMKLEKTQPAGCYVADSTHLVVKVLPHAKSAQVHNRNQVLGIATLDEKGVGYYGYVFYDRVQKLAEERRLGDALLADVLAHEIGHLLLGSNSHSISGIMSGQWGGEGLRRVSEGSLLFTSLESKAMRDRLGSSLSGLAYPVPIAVDAPATRSAQADPRTVKKLEWIEMAQLATILFPVGPAEIPAGGSMKIGTAGHGVSICTYIKDCQESALTLTPD